MFVLGKRKCHTADRSSFQSCVWRYPIVLWIEHWRRTCAGVSDTNGSPLSSFGPRLLCPFASLPRRCPLTPPCSLQLSGCMGVVMAAMGLLYPLGALSLSSRFGCLNLKLVDAESSSCSYGVQIWSSTSIMKTSWSSLECIGFAESGFFSRWTVQCCWLDTFLLHLIVYCRINNFVVWLCADTRPDRLRRSTCVLLLALIEM